MTELMATPETLRAQALRDASLSSLKRLFLLSLGGGAAVRGAIGLGRTLGRAHRGNELPVNAPLIVDVPYPSPEEKQADLGTTLGNVFNDYLVTPAKKLTSGEYASTPMGQWWYMPAAVATGAAGFSGGMKAVDSLLAARRRSALEEERQRAEDEFQAAIMSQYDSGKAADDNELSRELDGLYDDFCKLSKAGVLEKLAFAPGDLAGVLAGIGVTTLGGLTLAAGHKGYADAASHSRRQILEEALMRRRRALARLNPPAVYARPVAVSPPAGLDLPDDIEEQDAA